MEEEKKDLAMERKKKKVVHLNLNLDDIQLSFQAVHEPITGNDEGSADIAILLQDHTTLILPSPEDWRLYAIPCTLTSPFYARFHTKACHYSCPAATRRAVVRMIPPDFPMQQSQRVSLESMLPRLLRQMVNIGKAEGLEKLSVIVKAAVERTMEYANMHELLEDIKASIATEQLVRLSREGEMSDLELMIERARQRWEEKLEVRFRGDRTCKDCAVCFERVEMSWFKGVKLCCSHVFHLSCVVPWLIKNNSCPMCRC